MQTFRSIWDVTSETANPRARALLGKSIVWNYGDEDSPLGTDVGADTFGAYIDFRSRSPASAVARFITEQLALRRFSDSNWDVVDPKKLDDLLNAGDGV